MQKSKIDLGKDRKESCCLKVASEYFINAVVAEKPVKIRGLLMSQISVVIPSYNEVRYIQGTIESVLKQTVTDFDIVVVDEGSTDGTLDILKSFKEDRLKVVDQRKVGRSGISAARNIGIQEAQSDFVAFLDADDEWESDHLEALLELRKYFPDAGLYSTFFEEIPVRRKIVRIHQLLNDSLGNETFSKINWFSFVWKGLHPCHTSAVAIDRNKVGSLGFFHENMIYGEDIDFFSRIALDFPVVVSPKGKSISRRDRGKSWIRFSNKGFRLENNGYCLSEKMVSSEETQNHFFLTKAKSYINSTRKEIFLAAWSFTFRGMKYCIRSGAKKEAFRLFIRASRFYGFPALIPLGGQFIKTFSLFLIPHCCIEPLVRLKRCIAVRVTEKNQGKPKK